MKLILAGSLPEYQDYLLKSQTPSESALMMVSPNSIKNWTFSEVVKLAGFAARSDAATLEAAANLVGTPVNWP